MRRFFIFSCFLFLLSAVTQGLAASPPSAEPDPFALVQTPILTVTQKKNIRVVYDIKDDVWDAGIGKGLYYARGLLEAYKSQGVSEKNIKISVVLHGPTVYWLLKEDVYRQHKHDEFDFNPHDRVLRELLAHGVSVEVCNLTLRGKGWTADDLMPGVTVVHDAYTRLIDLQQQGYAYIRF
jgi:intracellular sulfur oxidation DsrE/DsrF family protein